MKEKKTNTNPSKAMLYFEKAKPYLLTILYLAIFIALYLIYGSGDTQNNFIYNEF
ncbi:D-Ala-teichoic acid biosynthesis family protein [Staphylococcus petrasii]|uniref:D-Ala-teichoic acid biosynthesis family protein n=4 Tax=Staphylococcus TaxID=1279 RepID=A0A380G1W8_9STAP|nr:D-Ala-teichoic acid biosynthesis family protein [Staphylococcus petrasii]SUM60568.1 D-Ala-teichoic acid biosynthesis family protein [Staphylococcus petrasii]